MSENQTSKPGGELELDISSKDCRRRPTEILKAEAENEIVENQRIVDYDTKEYPVEVVVEKYVTGKDDDESEIFVPDYQRDFTWGADRQSKFIESVLIGLPIPYIFVADVAKGEGRLEIVDGSQRIRTLVAFLNDELELEGLKKLKKLNGFRFSDLPLARQRRFKRRTIRLIELTERADEEVRRDIFERINTGSDVLNDMEVRWGINKSPLLLNFIRECASDPLFKELAPLSDSAVRRRERDEFILRFFAYLDNYKNFGHRVHEFLDKYLESRQNGFDDQVANHMRTEYKQMLEFVKTHFPFGFRKGSNHARTPRIRFEAISVGVALALRENPQLVPSSMDWLNSPEFKKHTTSDASNSKPKVEGRIEYARDRLLGR